MGENDKLEAFVASIPSAGEPVQIPMEYLTAANTNAPVFSGADDPADFDDLAPALKLISVDAFQMQWALLHDMLGGVVQARTGTPCPLGDQARSEGGRVACDAAYHLLSNNPTLAKLILSEESTFFGQLAAIGVHGFACVQMVKASASGAVQSGPEKYEDAA